MLNGYHEYLQNLSNPNFPLPLSTAQLMANIVNQLYVDSVMIPDTQPKSLPPNHHLAHRNSGFAIIFSLPLLATFAVVLRITARFQKNARFGLDDWLIVLALLLYYALTGQATWGVLLGGYSLHAQGFSLAILELYLKVSLSCK